MNMERLKDNANTKLKRQSRDKFLDRLVSVSVKTAALKLSSSSSF